MGIRYKPWGLLQWVLRHCPQKKWGFLGGLSTEDRSISAWNTLRQAGLLADDRFLIVDDKASRFSQRTAARLAAVTDQLLALGGNEQHCTHHPLLATAGELEAITSRVLQTAGQSMVLDISSLPKRFFFGLLWFLVREKSLQDLIVTYTVPESYSSELLAEDYEPWQHLPLFVGAYPDAPPEMIIISVGYQTMGLPEQVEHGIPGVRVKLLFPFPPGPPSFQRNWEFVRELEKNIKTDLLEVVPIHARDCPDAFDHMLEMTDKGNKQAYFAPYGPKPISLAACLFACASQMPVFYTQPNVYHPDYSLGVSLFEGLPETYAYCVKLGGHSFYTV